MPQTPYNRDGRDFYKTLDGGRLLSVAEGQDARQLYPDKLAYASEDDYNARQAEKAEEAALANDVASVAYARDADGFLNPDAAFGTEPVDLSASPLNDQALDAAEDTREQDVESFNALPPTAPEAFSTKGRDYYKSPDGRILSVAAGEDPSEVADGLTPATEKDYNELVQKRSGGFKDSVESFFSGGRALVGQTVAGVVNSAEAGIQKATGYGTAKGLTERELGSKPVSPADIYPDEFTDKRKEIREANPTSTLLGTVAADYTIQAALNTVLPGSGSVAVKVGAYGARQLAAGIITEAGDSVISGDEFSMSDALFIWTPTNMAFEAVAPPVLRGAAQALGWTGKTAMRGSRNALNWVVDRANSRAVDDVLREENPVKRAGGMRKHADTIYARQQKRLDDALEVIDGKIADAPERLFTPSALGKSVSSNDAVQSDVLLRFAQSLDQAAQVTGNDTVKEAFETVYEAVGKSGAAQYGALRSAWKILDEAAIDNPLVREALDGLGETLGDAATWGKAAKHHAGIVADLAGGGAGAGGRSVRDMAAREAIERQLERARSVARLSDNKQLSAAVAEAEDALRVAGDVTGARAMGAALPDEVASLQGLIESFPDRMPKLTDDLTETLDKIELPDTWTANRTEQLLLERAAGKKTSKAIDKVLDDAERRLKGKPAAERVPGVAAIERARELLAEADAYEAAARRVQEAASEAGGPLRKAAHKAIDVGTSKAATWLGSKAIAGALGQVLGGDVGMFGAVLVEQGLQPAINRKAKAVGAWLKSKLRKHAGKALGVGLLAGSANTGTDEEQAGYKAMLANAGLLVLFLPHGGSSLMGESLAETLGNLTARERFTVRQATERAAATNEDFLRRYAAGERTFEHPSFGRTHDVQPSDVRDMQFTVALNEYARLHGGDIDAVPEYIKDVLSNDVYYRNAKIVEADPELLRLAQVQRFDVVAGGGAPSSAAPMRPGSNPILSELFPEGLAGRAAVEQGIQAKIDQLEASVSQAESDQVARIIVRGDVAGRMRAEFVEVNAAHATVTSTLDNVLDRQLAFFERRYREAYNQRMSEPARRLAREHIRLANVGDTFTSSQIQAAATQPGALPERFAAPQAVGGARRPALEAVGNPQSLRTYGLPDPDQVRIHEKSATNRETGFVPPGFLPEPPMAFDAGAVHLIDPVVEAERAAQRARQNAANRRRNGHGASTLDPERLDDDTLNALHPLIAEARAKFRQRYMRDPEPAEIVSWARDIRHDDAFNTDLTPAEEVAMHQYLGDQPSREIEDWVDDAVRTAANYSDEGGSVDGDDIVRYINSGETRAGNHTLTPWEEHQVRQRWEDENMSLLEQFESVQEANRQNLEDEHEREREAYGDDESPDSDAPESDVDSGPTAEVVRMPRQARGPARETGRDADVVPMRRAAPETQPRVEIESPEDNALIELINQAADEVGASGYQVNARSILDHVQIDAADRSRAARIISDNYATLERRGQVAHDRYMAELTGEPAPSRDAPDSVPASDAPPSVPESPHQSEIQAAVYMMVREGADLTPRAVRDRLVSDFEATDFAYSAAELDEVERYIGDNFEALTARARSRHASEQTPAAPAQRAFGELPSRFEARLQNFAHQDPASPRVEALYQAARTEEAWTPGELETLRLAISDSEPELRAMLESYGAAVTYSPHGRSYETPGQLMLAQGQAVLDRWQATGRGPTGRVSDIGSMIIDAEVTAMNARNARRMQGDAVAIERAAQARSAYTPPEPEITADTHDLMLPLDENERSVLRGRIQHESDELAMADDLVDVDTVIERLNADSPLEPHEEIFVRQEMGQDEPRNIARSVNRGVTYAASNAEYSGQRITADDAIEAWQSYDGTELTPWEEYHFRQEFESNEGAYQDTYDEEYRSNNPDSEPPSSDGSGGSSYSRDDGDGLPDDIDLEDAGLTNVTVNHVDGIRNVFGRDLTTEDLRQLFALVPLKAHAEETGGILQTTLTVNGKSVEYRGVVRGTEFEVSTVYTPGPGGKVDVYHNLLVVPPEMQGTGEARKILQGMVKVFERIGANEIKFSAAWIGQYAWAALGARSTAAAEQAAIQTFTQYLKGWATNDPANAYIQTLKKLKTLRDVADASVPLDTVASELGVMKARFKHLQRETGHVGELEFDDALIGTDRKTGEPVFRAGKFFLLSQKGPWNSNMSLEIRPGNPWYEQFKLRIGASAVALGLGLNEIFGAMREGPFEVGGLRRDEEQTHSRLQITAPPGAEEQARTIRDGVVLAAEALEERETALEETRAKLGFLAHQSRQAIYTAARSLASPEKLDRTVKSVPGITSNSGVARFLGDNGSLREAFDARRGTLMQLQRDPMSFVDDLAESFSELSDNAPELHAEVVAQTYKVAGFIHGKLPQTVGASLVRPEGTPPSAMAIRQFALYYSAATDPSTVIEDLSNNRVRKEQIDTLREVWPDTYSKLKVAVVEQISKARPTIAQRIRLDLLFDFGENLDRALAPGLVATYEAARAKARAPADGPGAEGKAAPSRRTNPSVGGSSALGALALGPGGGPGMG